MKRTLLLIIGLILSVTVLAHEPEECDCLCEVEYETVIGDDSGAMILTDEAPEVFIDVKRGVPTIGIPIDDDFLKRIQSMKSRINKIDRIPEPEGK
jgi:hypothetical protein